MKISSLDIQPVFAANVQAVYGEKGKAWLSQLPAHLETLAKLWDFHFIRSITDLSYNFVALVELNSNHQKMILKTAPHGGSLATEARWLQTFKRGVPLIYNFDETHNAFLMELLEPGEPLKSLVKKEQDETATRVICQAILELQSEQPKHSGFKHLLKLAEALPLLRGHIKNSMLSKAETLFRDLSADCKHDLLLHGDLHHDNILQSESSWKVIDPHGYIGDPVAEVGPMIHNPFDCFPTYKPLKQVITTRLKILAEMLPFDPQKIQGWAFCLTLLSAAWDFEEDARISSNKVEIASIIDSVKF